MQDEFKAIIEKNLPAQVGDVLKTRLEQAEKDSDTVKNQNEKIKDLNEIIDKLENIIIGYREFDKRNAELETREIKIKEEERNLKIKTLEYQLACEQEKTSFTKEVAMGLVRNTTYRESIFDNENSQGYYDHKNNWIPTNITKSSTKNKTTD